MRKGRTIAILLLSTIILMLCFTLFASADKATLGDVNHDGVIRAGDARLVLRDSARLEVYPSETMNEVSAGCFKTESGKIYDRNVADIDHDGGIRANDARKILRISARLDKIENYTIPTSSAPTETTTAEKTTVHVHEWDDGKVTTVATCAVPGVKSFTCSVCGKTKTEEISTTEDHSWDNGKETTVATCANPGVKTFTCSVCGKTKTEEIAITEDHSWDGGKVTTAATCAKSGIRTYTCTVCGRERLETIAATEEHEWNDGEVTTTATCTEPGVRTFTCSVCSQIRIEEIPATGEHTWDNGKVTTAASCTKSGVKTFTCAVCGQTKTEEIAPTGNHTWDNGKVTTEATCSNPGEVVFTCTVCGQTREETTEPTGLHKWDDGVEQSVAPGAQTTTIIYTCTVCGLTKSEERDRTYEKTVKERTIENGLEPADSMIAFPGVVFRYYYFGTVDFDQPILITDNVTIESTNALYVKYYVDDWDLPAYIHFCNPKDKNEIVDVLIDTSSKNTMALSTNMVIGAPGYYADTIYVFDQDSSELFADCSAELYCEWEDWLESAPYPCSPLDVYSFTDVDGIYSVIIRTGAENEQTIEIPAFINEGIAPNPNCPHVWDDGKVTSDATCGKTGTKTYTCYFCGKTETETIPSTGEHVWNNGIITLFATCARSGVKTNTCTTCGTTRTETIPATGEHTWANATCTRPATCTVCGATSGSPKEHVYYSGYCIVCGAADPTFSPISSNPFAKNKNDAPFHLYSNDGKTYLGKLTTNKYDRDGIWYEYGDYGSKYRSESIWNENGKYGGKYSQESAFNEYATSPPIIVTNSGKTIGYLTANKYTRNGYSITEVHRYLVELGL